MLERVLLVRDPELCDSLRERLLSEGIETVAVAATTTEFLTPEQIPLANSWIAFTSANGVRGFFQALKARGTSLPTSCRFAVVGKSTGRAVTEYFAQEPDLIAALATGAALGHELVERLPEGTALLYPCPVGHDSEFTNVCRAGGLTLNPLPVYRTAPIHPSLLAIRLQQAAPFDAAVFYAPSAVRAFVNAQPLPWSFKVVAIGPTTRAELERLGHNRLVTAERPEDEAVLAALLSLSSQSESLHA